MYFLVCLKAEATSRKLRNPVKLILRASIFESYEMLRENVSNESFIRYSLCNCVFGFFKYDIF